MHMPDSGWSESTCLPPSPATQILHCNLCGAPDTKVAQHSCILSLPTVNMQHVLVIYMRVADAARMACSFSGPCAYPHRRACMARQDVLASVCRRTQPAAGGGAWSDEPQRALAAAAAALQWPQHQRHRARRLLCLSLRPRLGAKCIARWWGMLYASDSVHLTHKKQDTWAVFRPGCCTADAGCCADSKLQMVACSPSSNQHWSALTSLGSTCSRDQHGVMQAQVS